jgi:hypothetical protein
MPKLIFRQYPEGQLRFFSNKGGGIHCHRSTFGPMPKLIFRQCPEGQLRFSQAKAEASNENFSNKGMTWMWKK